MKILSLFSGIGAFEKALTNLNVNYEVVNYCEIDKFASCAYSAIHGVSEELNLGDISKVKAEDIKDFDLMTYGFPCQDISLAGKMKGIIKGETRSGLLYEALRIIEAKKPKYAIAENVKNLVSKKFMNDFQEMLKELENMGYNSYWKVLNSKDFGAPQSRERVFIISIRKDIDTGEFSFPSGFESRAKLRDILEKEVDEKYYIEDKYIKDLIRSFEKRVIGSRKVSKYGLLEVGKIENPKLFKMNRRVYSEEGISPTLTTSSSDNVPKIFKCNIRKLMPLECWKATGFADDDYWKVRKSLEDRFYKGKDRSDSQMYKMAGNSIVVPVLEHIFKKLLEVQLGR